MVSKTYESVFSEYLTTHKLVMLYRNKFPENVSKIPSK